MSERNPQVDANMSDEKEILLENTIANMDPQLLQEEEESENDKLELPKFDEDMVKKYPKSTRKLNIDVAPYSINVEKAIVERSHSVHISPYGLEFKTSHDYPEGTLLKINVNLPEYWTMKESLVEYRRVDSPDTFRILAKVVRSETIGKRGKKRLTMAQTVNMDEIDERVLRTYLQNG